MKSLLCAASAVLALNVVGSSEASAQHYACGSGYGYGGGYSSPGLSVSIGYGNVGYGNVGGYSSYGTGYNQFQGYGGGPVYGGRTSRVWHNTSHLDYHGPSAVPHRGHLDYVPGHYDQHRSGHWDRIRH